MISLAAVIAGRRLAGEDLHPRRPVARRLGADGVVERDGLEDVEQLALVFVDALDLHVEQRVGIDAAMCSRSAISAASATLLARRTRGELLLAARRRRRSAAKPSQRRRRRRAPPRPTRVDEQRGQAGIGLDQPAAEGDAVGLVDDAAGVERVEVAEHRLAHQVGVQRRDAVDLVRADEGERSPCARGGRRARRSARPTRAVARIARARACAAPSRCRALIR